MAEKLNEEKKARTGHRIYVRRLLDEAEQLLYKYDGQNTEQRNRVKHLRSTLRKKVDVIGALDESIMSRVKEGEIEHEITESSFFIDEVNFCITSLDELQIEEPAKNGHEGVKTSNSHPSNTGFAKVRLPKLELMKLTETLLTGGRFGTIFNRLLPLMRTSQLLTNSLIWKRQFMA